MSIQQVIMVKCIWTKDVLKMHYTRLVDQFNDRLISHKDFCETFLKQIHPFRDENNRTLESPSMQHIFD